MDLRTLTLSLRAAFITKFVMSRIPGHIKAGMPLYKLVSIIDAYYMKYKPSGPYGLHYVSICINNELCHNHRARHQTRCLAKGDIVKVDLYPCINGRYADMARTFVIHSSKHMGAIVNLWNLHYKYTTSYILDEVKAFTNKHFSDYMFKHRKYISKARLIPELSGHCLGSSIHLEPIIPSIWSKDDICEELPTYTCFAIEPLYGLHHKDEIIHPPHNICDPYPVIKVRTIGVHFEDMFLYMGLGKVIPLTVNIKHRHFISTFRIKHAQ